MVLRVLNWGKEPIYYVQKSYRKEDVLCADASTQKMLPKNRHITYVLTNPFIIRFGFIFSPFGIS